MKPAGGWIPWVSRRFLTGRRGGRGRLVFLFAVVLIGSGVATLNTILAVMNGLQQGYIRSILEIGSYHLRWTADADPTNGALDIPRVIASIESDPKVALAVPFREGQTMLSGERPRPLGALVRGVPDTLYHDDVRLADRLDIVEGSFLLAGGGIVLGDELALGLGVSPGDTITALDLGSAGLNPGETELTVTGLFRCGYREYESTLAFVSLATAGLLFGPGVPDVGVKLTRVETDRTVMGRLGPVLEDSGGSLESWRDANRSFFGALRTEKVMMLLLLALIFVVVSVNIDHSLRRMATERTEDLSLLKAIGASPGDIRRLFLRYGLVIGGSGGVVGSIFGVLIGANVHQIIRFFENAVSMMRDIIGIGSYRPGAMEAFFRSSEVMPGDVVTIFLLAIALSTLSAVRAASMAARLKPAEVLRSE